jgi:glutamate synthase domain-containing protein 3
MEMVDLESVDDPADQLALRQMIEWHLSHTGSETARNIIKNWKSMIPKFVKVMPTAYSQVFEKNQISQPKEIQAVLHG